MILYLYAMIGFIFKSIVSNYSYKGLIKLKLETSLKSQVYDIWPGSQKLSSS
jgi:hypothetical protein